MRVLISMPLRCLTSSDRNDNVLKLCVVIAVLMVWPSQAIAAPATAKLSGDVATVEWPQYTCATDEPLDADPDASIGPAPAGSDPVITIDGPGEDVPDDGSPVDDSGVVPVLPWRAVYYPDGTIVEWHDWRCVGDAEGAELLDPSPTQLAAAKRAIKLAKRSDDHRRRRRHP
jgi:hypothetical protein